MLETIKNTLGALFSALSVKNPTTIVTSNKPATNQNVFFDIFLMRKL